jgi:hypothetical protein
MWQGLYNFSGALVEYSCVLDCINDNDTDMLQKLNGLYKAAQYSRGGPQRTFKMVTCVHVANVRWATAAFSPPRPQSLRKTLKIIALH